jgi:hypothetical protein
MVRISQRVLLALEGSKLQVALTGANIIKILMGCSTVPAQSNLFHLCIAHAYNKALGHTEPDRFKQLIYRLSSGAWVEPGEGEMQPPAYSLMWDGPKRPLQANLCRFLVLDVPTSAVSPGVITKRLTVVYDHDQLVFADNGGNCLQVRRYHILPAAVTTTCRPFLNALKGLDADEELDNQEGYDVAGSDFDPPPTPPPRLQRQNAVADFTHDATVQDPFKLFPNPYAPTTFSSDLSM